MSRLPPPISDYVTDTRSALDNSVRLAQVRSTVTCLDSVQQHLALQHKIHTGNTLMYWCMSNTGQGTAAC